MIVISIRHVLFFWFDNGAGEKIAGWASHLHSTFIWTYKSGKLFIKLIFFLKKNFNSSIICSWKVGFKEQKFYREAYWIEIDHRMTIFRRPTFFSDRMLLID